MLTTSLSVLGAPSREETNVVETLSAAGAESELAVDLRVVDDARVRLSYRFHNRSSANAYLFNKLYRDFDGKTGLYTTDTNLVYCEVVHDRTVLSKRIVPVPDDLEVEKPVIPCVTRVRPGEWFQEEVVVALPLRPWTPYLEPKDTQLKQSALSQPVVFELGFFVSSAAEPLAGTVQTSQGPALYFYPFSPARQKVLRVGPFKERLRVLGLKEGQSGTSGGTP